MSKSQKNKKQQEADSSMTLYAVVGVICAIAIAVVLVLNSGILQRSLAAVTVNGEKYSAADMQYYYNMIYMQEYNMSQTYAMYGMKYGFDYQKKPKEQIYDEETGQTWEEHFLDSAREYVSGVAALAQNAKAEGYVMGEEGQETLRSMISSIDTAWIGSYNSRDAFLRSNYGSYMTYKRFIELLEMEVYASDYGTAVRDTITYTDEDCEAYYEEHKDELDTFVITQFALRAEVDSEEEMTEEETAEVLEQRKNEVRAIAEEIQEKLKSGVSAEQIAQDYEDVLYSHAVAAERTASSVENSSYAEWAMDENRQSGDVTVAEYDAGSYMMYYVAQYQNRFRDDSKTADVRHILVGADIDEGASEPTEEQYNIAKQQAQALLDEWKSGEATEDSFVAMVADHTADTSSAETGGLLESVSKSSGYVQTFTDWALDETRKPGDTGLVQNTGSSVKGWHIMYYVADGEPVWKQTARDTMISDAYLAWEDEIAESAEVVDGNGMIFVR